MKDFLKLLFLLSPVIVWSSLVWYSFKWEKKFKGKGPEELNKMNYYKRKKRNDLLLWFSGFIATIIFMIILVKLR